MGAQKKAMRSYVSPTGRDKIEQWYQDLSAQEQADADVFIANQRGIAKWELPSYRYLFDGIGELRWPSAQKQHRLLGYFDGATWIALVGCTHKQRVYTPRDCLNTARKRKGKLSRGEAKTVEFDL
jgi:hypothetical protein